MKKTIKPVKTVKPVKAVKAGSKKKSCKGKC